MARILRYYYGMTAKQTTNNQDGKMKIALVHDHYDEEHLAKVIDEMKILGAPKIKAVWMECYGHWAALEGCHRIRAAKALGLIPEIDEVGYDDDTMCSDVLPGYNGGEDYSIAHIADSSNL